MIREEITRRFRRNRQELLLTILIAALAVSSYLFFSPFLNSGPASPFQTEVLAAMLGSILTVMITMLLIRRQGTVEQAQQSAGASKTRIFERKLELFKDFIGLYVQCASDGLLDKAELAKLEELALTITLFTQENLGEEGALTDDISGEICRYVLQLELFGLQEELNPSMYPLYDQHLAEPGDRPEDRKLIPFVNILRLMKVELGVALSELDDPGLENFARGDHFWTSRLIEYRIDTSAAGRAAEAQKAAREGAN